MVVDNRHSRRILPGELREDKDWFGMRCVKNVVTEIL